MAPSSRRSIRALVVALTPFACQSNSGGSNAAGAQGGSGAGQAAAAGSGRGSAAAGAGAGGANAAGASTAAGGAGANAGGGPASSGGSPSSGGAGPSGGASGSCGRIITFEDGRSPSSELHVATTGSDASGDGTANKPFASIRRAAEDAAPGVAIRIHAGTYAGEAFLDGLSGTEAAPIWLGGMPGEARPILDGGAQALHLVRARWLVVHDLEVRNQTANGINADDGGDRANAQASHSLIFRNLDIHDVGAGGNQDCLKLSGINAYFVLDSRFARCGGGSSGSAIDHVGCHDGLIARSEFNELSGGNAVQCKGGSRNIEIRWNRIRGGGERAVNLGGSTGFEFFRPPLSTSAPNAEATDIRVIANVIAGGVASLGFVGCVDCLAANNTLVDPERWVLRILQETITSGSNVFSPARNGRFVNNLVYFSRTGFSTTINIGPNTEPASFSFANNLWFAHDEPNRSTPTDRPVPEAGGIYARDPLLEDAANGDYAIRATSPAAAAGMALPELSGDILGRCWSNPPSIGAFEVQ